VKNWQKLLVVFAVAATLILLLDGMFYLATGGTAPVWIIWGMAGLWGWFAPRIFPALNWTFK
jgi:hypothetical protein